MVKQVLRAIKGTHDILPGESWRWQDLETKLHAFMKRYGYSEIRTPAFEKTELFARGVGEETDIVSKEMYSWTDQSGVALTLKPELTAPVVRAFIQHNLTKLAPITKLYYIDALFRRERPQKGRYRQFHQFGIEALGSDHPEQDVEVIEVAYRFFNELGLSGLTLKLNSIGSPECRDNYREALRGFLCPELSRMSETSQRRFETNPLRILDTKVPHELEILKKAPVITDYLTADDNTHFDTVKALLDKINIPYELDNNMVRGLDYYTRTTFEITSNALGAQSAICGGGRYDKLVETLGGKPTPAVGFAAGIERILLVLDSEKEQIKPLDLQVYFICHTESARSEIIEMVSKLRKDGFSVEFDMLRRSSKAQFRDANRLNAKITVIIGEEELKNGTVQVKDMSTGEQQELLKEDLFSFLSKHPF